MAEYGILLWHDENVSKRSTQKVEYPGEYDIIVNLDARAELQAKRAGSLMKVEAAKGILKTPGGVEIAGFNETLSTHNSSETMKKELSDIVTRGFIDRCIRRLTEEDKKENLKKAILRAKFEPYWMGLTYHKAGSGMFGVQLTHCEIVTRKYILQTAFVERRSVCKKRLHLDGLERLMSQLNSHNLMNCYLGKGYTTGKNYVDINDHVGTEKSVLFMIEVVRQKFEIQAVTTRRETRDSEYHEALIQAEARNKNARTTNIIAGTIQTGMKRHFEDFVEEVKDVMSSAQIDRELVLFGRESKAYPAMRIIAWKTAGDAQVKPYIKTSRGRSDLKRIPMKTRGVLTLFASSLTELFVEVAKPGNLKTCGQPTGESDAFWTEWLEDLKYQDGNETEKKLKTLYGNMDLGCEMEQVLLITLYDISSFLYTMVVRNTQRQYRVRLLKEVLAGVKLSPSKDDKVRKANETKIQSAIDSYVGNTLYHDKWDSKLLEMIIDGRSIPLALVYILRYANGDVLEEIDADELESDFNLVMMGQMPLESVLRVYVPYLCEIYQKALNLNSASTIDDIIGVLLRHNMLIFLLSTFLEFKIKHMKLGGIPMFKRYVKDRYHISYLTPFTTGRVMDGLQLADTIHYMFDQYLCSEFEHEIFDRFEYHDERKRSEEWTDYVKTEEEKIDLEKEKYGERGTAWAAKQKAKISEERANANFRHYLLQCVKEIFFTGIYSRSERCINLEYITTISHKRMNYQRMSMLMGSFCGGYTDFISLCMPITAPHKSMIVICIYSEMINDTVARLCLKNRFKRVYSNIYQFIFIKVKPQEVKYDESKTSYSCIERFNVKSEGPMQVRVLPYLSQGVDARTVIVKSDRGERGSKYFFVKLSGAE
ncbi:VP2 [Mobuck virus]|uniref:VP2 n=1 Tax=Mobuck virus TaxID=1408137 RepID=UPI0003BA0A7A|nr:VP2 [Mobuck virus]AGX89721.1 VP2 [Mobuck virus]